MKIHEFGDKISQLYYCYPETMCYWKGNFGTVIDKLSKEFLVGAVAYTGFDESDSENFTSILNEVEKIEKYVTANYRGKICAIYGSSLGGSLVAHLVHRNKIQIENAIIGSSDFDQAGKIKASLMTGLILRVTYNFIHTGSYKSKLMKKRFESQMSSTDPYNKAFVALIGRDKYDMSFITKESIKNQFKSDLITKLPEQIDNRITHVHIFFAGKMGEKYLERYNKIFKNPIVHMHDMRHEELLGVYPDDWVQLVKKICFANKK